MSMVVLLIILGLGFAAGAAVGGIVIFMALGGRVARQPPQANFSAEPPQVAGIDSANPYQPSRVQLRGAFPVAAVLAFLALGALVILVLLGALLFWARSVPSVRTTPTAPPPVRVR